MAGELGAGELQLTREGRFGYVRLRVTGELDVATAPLLRAELDELAAQSQVVLIDLSQLEFVDSTGLQTLLSALRRTSEGSEAVTLDPRCRPAVRKVFEICSLESLLVAD
jgi:anti-sigma B factor antagonist